MTDPRRRHPVARLARAAGATGLLATALGATAWYQLLRRPLPRTEGTERVRGLEAEVEIARDRWAVPHISARSEHDLWFGQGYVHAQDRLFQMDFHRRLTAGRLAELVGPEALETDRFMRTLGLRRVASIESSHLPANERVALEAYCAGVSAGTAGLAALPFEHQLLRSEPEPWRPVDMLTVAKLLALGLSTNWERELLRAELAREVGPELAARLEPNYPEGHPIAPTPGTGFSGESLGLLEQFDRVRRAIGLAPGNGGSNNWVVSGARTTTGDPLVAGDPHLPSAMPGIWHAASLRVGERFVRGCCLPGFPGVWMGQNASVAWSFTNTMADVMDLFVEQVEGDRYTFRGEQLPLVVHEEEIEVRGRAEPERHTVRETHHGPVINDLLGADPDTPLALRWSGHDHPAYGRHQLHALSIESGAELEEMMRDFALPVSNMLWADASGSIGFHVVGAIPIRDGDCPDLPKPGWSGDFEWTGWVPFDELPAARDPERGYLVTANNRIAGDDHPHHISSDWLDGFRARRIEELLEARAEHDPDSFTEIQLDVHSLPGVETVRRLARLSPRGQRETWALERLKSWDGDLAPDSVEATIYQAFTLRLARELCRAVIGDRDLTARWLDRSTTPLFAHVASPWRWQAHLLDLWAESDEELVGRPWEELALEALRGALDDLEDRFGPEPDGWRWGDAHELDFPHPLGAAHPLLGRLLNRRVRVGGGQETVNQIAYDPTDPFRGLWGPSYRMVCDPCRPDAGRWQLFTGQSGHPASPHYDDLQEAWRLGRTQPMAGDGPWQRLRLVPDR